MNEHETLKLLARAAEMVAYNPETGSMTWRCKGHGIKDSTRWNSRYAGKECGAIDSYGYRRLGFRFEFRQHFKIRAHRLAWFISYGTLPNGEIDHINQNKTDNRIANLRDVPASLNQRNRTRNINNTSGVAGVSWDKLDGKWRAQGHMNGHRYNLGRFNEIEDAEAAARKFRSENKYTETHGRLKVTHWRDVTPPPEVTVLPDGSAFGMMSFPLPYDHWMYRDREYLPGADEPVDLPKPILTHALREHVEAAVRYAVRGATNCGKELDFDPDALVLNAVYALCGPYGGASLRDIEPPTESPIAAKCQRIEGSGEIGRREVKS